MDRVDLVLVGSVVGLLWCLARARRRTAAERAVDLAAPARTGPRGIRHPRLSWSEVWPLAGGAALTVGGALLGWSVMGPIGLLFAGFGVAFPRVINRKRSRRREELLEGQVGELASAVAQGVRSGLSIAQGMAAAALDAEPPLRPLLEEVIRAQHLGSSLESALDELAVSIGTDDARLLVLILLTHARSGGNIAVALHEVAATIRHRVEARRELRALTAQGRISGAILGTLPIGFFVLMALTSGPQLGEVYRSGPGVVMVIVGLGLESLAYLWIRQLLRIEV